MKTTTDRTIPPPQKPDRHADKAEGESAVLAKIAEMPEPDRTIGGRLHAIIRASAPVLSPRRRIAWMRSTLCDDTIGAYDAGHG